ncbi:MAG: class I SAM-dependent RNA methyltransferase [Pikeienuella sp.]
MEQITIERLAAQGDGIGAGVFAPFTLPGDIVEGAVADGRMAAPRVITPSPHRQTPPCPHFGTCGGCSVQHGNEAFIAGWKRDQVIAALAHRGIENVEVRETLTSPARSRRRATFAARRTKKTVQVGFHAARSDTLIPIEACEVLRPELLAARETIKEAVRIGGSRKGVLRATVTLTENGVDMGIEGGKPLHDIWAAAAALAEAHDLARLTWNGEPVVTRRPPTLPMGAAHVAPPPGGFLQATAEGEAALIACAAEALALPKRARILDLFAGCGTFTLPFADRTEVHAVEGDKALLTALTTGWRAVGGLAQVTTEARDLFRRPLLAADFKGYDAAIIDPPRAGAAAQTAEIAKSDLKKLASISCDPATFARDARTLLDAGWKLNWVQPVDQFRWSPHVELAAAFSR